MKSILIVLLTSKRNLVLPIHFSQTLKYFFSNILNQSSNDCNSNLCRPWALKNCWTFKSWGGSECILRYSTKRITLKEWRKGKSGKLLLKINCFPVLTWMPASLKNVYEAGSEVSYKSFFHTTLKGAGVGEGI